MERFFYPAMLGDRVDANWHQLLLAELAKPRSPMSRADALGWRLGRNYLWIYTAVLVAWLAKLDLAQPKGWVLSFPEAFTLADIGSFPGWLVALGVALFYLHLIWLAVRAFRTYPQEEG